MNADRKLDALSAEFFDAVMSVDCPLEDYLAALNGIRERAADLATMAKNDIAARDKARGRT